MLFFLLFHSEFVVVHAVHVALDEGFHLAFHLAERVLRHGAEHIVLESRVCAIVIGMGDAVPIEFDGVVAFHKFIPIDFGYPMHGNGFVGRRVEHVLSESEVRDVVTQVVEDRWHDVGLLHHTFRVVINPSASSNAFVSCPNRWLISKNRRPLEESRVCAFWAMVR